MEPIFLYSTWPDQQSAEFCAKSLLENRLIACANIIPGVASVFRWEDQIQSATESVMIVKTVSDHAAQVRDKIVAIHPYDIPAISAIRVDRGSSNLEFCAWIERETR